MYLGPFLLSAEVLLTFYSFLNYTPLNIQQCFLNGSSLPVTCMLDPLPGPPSIPAEINQFKDDIKNVQGSGQFCHLVITPMVLPGLSNKVTLYFSSTGTPCISSSIRLKIFLIIHYYLDQTCITLLCLA